MVVKKLPFLQKMMVLLELFTIILCCCIFRILWVHIWLFGHCWLMFVVGFFPFSTITGAWKRRWCRQCHHTADSSHLDLIFLKIIFFVIFPCNWLYRLCYMKTTSCIFSICGFMVNNYSLSKRKMDSQTWIYNKEYLFNHSRMHDVGNSDVNFSQQLYNKTNIIPKR